MKTNTASFFLLPMLFAGFTLLSGSCYAQNKSDDKANAKKTITIHVTKEVDGNKVVIDTTVVTDGEFDADAFLKQKGVLNDVPEDGKMERHIVIRHPGSEEFTWSDSDAKTPDTLKPGEDREIIFSDKFDRPFPPMDPQNKQFHYYFNMPDDAPMMQPAPLDRQLEQMFRSNGLEDLTPLGDMKQMVVKKKRNGKKIIITFQDPDPAQMEQSKGNAGNHPKQKVKIIKHSDMGMNPPSEERIIIEGQPEGNMVIHKNIETNGDQKTITITAEDGTKPNAVKQEKKVIIIKEEKEK